MSSFDGVNITTTNPYRNATELADLQARLYHELGIHMPKTLAALTGQTGAKTLDELYNKPYDMPEEKWVWVTGYKGMDKDMKCMNDFQYEVGKTYDMPEGEEILVCHSGFHMCLKLEDVFDYQRIEKGNRFFEVRALVRESDRDAYGRLWGWESDNNKLAAKSIEIVRELSVDEILAHIPEAAEWSDEIKELALEKNVNAAKTEGKVYNLVNMGYSIELARYICNDTHKSGYELAMALDTQPGISMDTKILAIFSHV